MRVDFSGIDAKIKRAKKNISDLQEKVSGLGEPDPDITFCYCELDTRNGILALNPDARYDLGAIVGDILHDLRSALDHLFWRLLDRNGWTPGPSAKHYFPIRDTSDLHKSAVKGVKEQVGKDAMKLLRATEAYQGGKGHALWQLNELNIADKHRLIITMLAKLEHLSFDGGAHMRALFDDPTIPSLRVPIHPRTEIRRQPLEGGAILLRVLDFPPEVDMYIKPALDITFGKGEIVEGEPILPTLLNLAELVEGTVKPFRLLP